MLGEDFARAVRKSFGIKSPMNVWKRQFTECPQLFECMAALALPPIEMPNFRIGDTITIKRPARYQECLPS